jgi:allantoinase
MKDRTMSHGRFDYSPITARSHLKLPDGARVAVWVTPNIEYFHWKKRAIAMTQITAALSPDVLNHGWREYGARVGIWRIMEIMERTGFVATAALNSDVCQHYPEIVKEGNRLGWEWMAHGQSNSSLLTGLAEADERAIIKDVLDTIGKATGKRCRGWLGPALTETDNTLDLLAETDVEYVSDWCNDELPYWMKTRSKPIIAMPYTLEIGDIPIFLENGGNADDFYRAVVDQFDVMYEDGAKIPRVLSIAIHPFLIGHPFRAKGLQKALEHIARHDHVWIATGSAIADWFKKSQPAP